MKHPIIIISGPSGAGKSTIIHRLKETGKYRFSVSATSRRRRPGEAEGVHYFFKSEDEMLGIQQFFLEFTIINGHYYGTPRSELEKLEHGPLVLDVDILGFEAIRARCKDIPIVSIFIAPPSMEELERRLRNRGDTSQEQLRKRLERAAWEMKEAPQKYHHIVVNDDLEAAVHRIQEILEHTSLKEA